jgi:hypothetical protein
MLASNAFGWSDAHTTRLEPTAMSSQNTNTVIRSPAEVTAIALPA